MTFLGGPSAPGFGSLEQTTEKEILWVDDRAKGQALFGSAIISGAARDAGNSPTTVLRPGLLLGQLTSGSELEEWDADASDGSEKIYGILAEELRMQDFNANNADRAWRVLLRGPVRVNELLIQGTAFTTHVDEFLARRMMWSAGFVFDDDPMGWKAGNERFANKTADYTVVEADNGTIFVSSGADTEYTLPTIHPGLKYQFVMAADQELKVSSAAGDDIIIGNDLSADSVTYTTASEQIGARLTFECIYFATTLKWLVRIDKVPFSTDDYLTVATATE